MVRGYRDWREAELALACAYGACRNQQAAQKGFEVSRTKAKKSGETVYTIVTGKSAEIKVEAPSAAIAGTA